MCSITTTQDRAAEAPSRQSTLLIRLAVWYEVPFTPPPGFKRCDFPTGVRDPTAQFACSAFSCGAFSACIQAPRFPDVGGKCSEKLDVSGIGESLCAHSVYNFLISSLETVDMPENAMLQLKKKI